MSTLNSTEARQAVRERLQPLRDALAAIEAATDGHAETAARREAATAFGRLRDALTVAAVQARAVAAPTDKLPHDFEALAESARDALSWIRTHVQAGRVDAALAQARKIEAIGTAIRAGLDPAERPVFRDIAPRAGQQDPALRAAIEALAKAEFEVSYSRKHVEVLDRDARENRLTSVIYNVTNARNALKKLPK